MLEAVVHVLNTECLSVDGQNLSIEFYLPFVLGVHEHKAQLTGWVVLGHIFSHAFQIVKSLYNPQKPCIYEATRASHPLRLAELESST